MGKRKIYFIDDDRENKSKNQNGEKRETMADVYNRELMEEVAEEIRRESDMMIEKEKQHAMREIEEAKKELERRKKDIQERVERANEIIRKVDAELEELQRAKKGKIPHQDVARTVTEQLLDDEKIGKVRTSTEPQETDKEYEQRD